MKSANKKRESFFNRLHALQKIGISIAVSLAVYFFVPFTSLNDLAHIMLAWDAFCLSMLALSWYTFWTTDDHHIREQAKDQDGSRVVVFTLTIICTFASLMAVLILLISRGYEGKQSALLLAIAIGGMALSWLLVHTIFAYRYAHIYYGDHKAKKGTDQQGLDFPGDGRPTLIDFAYFSFVLGMTFQVSDVSITSPVIRRLALFQGLLSFAFNTTIIALTINMIAGLSN